MRGQEEARRIIRREHRPQIPQPKSLATFLAEPDETARYRIEGLWPSGGNVLLSAQYKAGKTTMVHNLVRSLVDGVPFLEQFDTEPVSGRVVVLDFEMPEAEARRWLRDTGIERADAVMYMNLRGQAAAFDPTDPACRAEWAELLLSVGCDVLVVDCLAPITAALGLDEKDGLGPVLQGLTALGAEAGGAEVFLIQHMGHKNERARGDSNLLGWPDALWTVARPGEDPAGPRYFKAFGRSVDVPEACLVYDGQSRALSLGDGGRRRRAEAGTFGNGVDRHVQELLRAGVPEGLGRDRLKAWADSHGVALPSNNGVLSQITKAVKAWQESERLPGLE
ncbi:AAA family ATPase [Streptomyces sp. NPDC002698]|uniref:AAA family ATPase n=1 Tax=Streptomyces sp. NPDC002698 TaxID=3364660 RepID=UPI00367EA407